MNKAPLLLNGVFLVAVSAFQGMAQNRISGRVVDANTGEPLPFASVFFAGTSIGNTTNGEGWFAITGFASGKYDFTVSFVGYTVYQAPYTFTGKEQVRLLIKLGPDTRQLQEVVIRPNDRERRINYQAFKLLFLGDNKFGKQCEIMNPDDIYVYRDTEEAVLVAHATKPIIVENRALGYRIQYHLALFEHHYFSGRLDVYGFTQFEQLKPRSSGELKIWEQKRSEVYNGSLVHFMRSLAANRLVEENFFVSRVLQVPNPEKPPQEIIQRKMDSLSALLDRPQTERNAVRIRQELSHYGVQKVMPATIDSFTNETLRGHELLNPDTLNQVGYTGALVVRYGTGEKEKDTATRGVPRIREGHNSGVTFLSKFRIYENGYFDNLGTMLITGYFSLSEKVSMMVPLEYGVESQ